MDIIDAVIKNDVKTVLRLLQEGADPNYAEDDDNITPLHFTVVYEAIDAIPLLISAGANLDAKTHDGLTPLDCANGTNILNLSSLVEPNSSD